MKSWANQFRPSATQYLHDIRDADRELADQTGHSAGRIGMVFQKAASVTIFTMAALSGAWAAIHLWRELFPRQRQQFREPGHTRRPYHGR